MTESPLNSTKIRNLLRSALTDRIDDREIFMKGIDYSYYYESDDPGSDFRAEKPTGKRGWDCVHAGPSLYAGYPHLYLPANPEFALNFARRASEYDPL